MKSGTILERRRIIVRIVIDISEEVFDEIYNNNYYSLKGKAELRVAVRNSTPKPKQAKTNAGKMWRKETPVHC